MKNKKLKNKTTENQKEKGLETMEKIATKKNLSDNPEINIF